MRRVALVVAVAASVAPARALPPLPLVRLTQVATLSQPVGMAIRANDPALYLVEKTGRVRAIRGGALDPTPALSLAGQVSQGGEQGLLGLAFSPDGSRMYVDFTDLAGDTRVVEYQMSGGVADPATRRDLLFVDQPFSNHNGGQLGFGPDGSLHISLGDGGSAGDSFNAGQRLDTLLGKILRIGTQPSGSLPYTIPADNPFVGTPGARGEIWAYGLRNPWRFSFDRLTGDLWVADVGQNAWEEIDFQQRSSDGGENYGWRRMEGNHPYQGGTPPPDHVPPIHEYSHAFGCSVTGGFVYRGARMPLLQGAYVFADFCAGRLKALQRIAGQVVELDLAATVSFVTSFGEDQEGELYAMSLNGPLYRIEPAVP